MLPIDFLILCVFFLLVAFGHAGTSAIALSFLFLALLLGRLLTGGTISIVIARRQAPPQP